jgi:hypothetical protein
MIESFGIGLNGCPRFAYDNALLKLHAINIDNNCFYVSCGEDNSVSDIINRNALCSISTSRIEEISLNIKIYEDVDLYTTPHPFMVRSIYYNIFSYKSMGFLYNYYNRCNNDVIDKPVDNKESEDEDNKESDFESDYEIIEKESDNKESDNKESDNKESEFEAENKESEFEAENINEIIRYEVIANHCLNRVGEANMKYC